MGFKSGLQSNDDDDDVTVADDDVTVAIFIYIWEQTCIISLEFLSPIESRVGYFWSYWQNLGISFFFISYFFSGGNIKKCPRLQKLMVVSVECGISHNAMLERPHHWLYLIGVEAPTSTKEKQIS